MLRIGGNLKLSKGFTLIELLVVIAIIGILVSAGLASYSTAREQARDARRVEDMHNIQTSLEQYFAEKSAYPNPYSIAFDASVPVDPINQNQYIYNWTYYTPPSYCVCAEMETRTGNADAPNGTTCRWNSTDGAYFCVQNQQ